jgi:hypothetical protein
VSYCPDLTVVVDHYVLDSGTFTCGDRCRRIAQIIGPAASEIESQAPLDVLSGHRQADHLQRYPQRLPDAVQCVEITNEEATTKTPIPASR